MFVTGIWTDGLGHRLEDYKWTADELEPPSARSTTRASRSACTRSATPARSSARCARWSARRQRNPKPIRHRLEHVEQLEDLGHLRRLVKLGMRVTLTRAQRSSGAAAGGRRFAPSFAKGSSR